MHSILPKTDFAKCLYCSTIPDSTDNFTYVSYFSYILWDEIIALASQCDGDLGNTETSIVLFFIILVNFLLLSQLSY